MTQRTATLTGLLNTLLEQLLKLKERGGGGEKEGGILNEILTSK